MRFRKHGGRGVCSKGGLHPMLASIVAWDGKAQCCVSLWGDDRRQVFVLEAEALVLHTPARSFSFLFANGAARKVSEVPDLHKRTSLLISLRQFRSGTCSVSSLCI